VTYLTLGVRGAFGACYTSASRFLLFLFPSWLDASENLPGFLNIAGGPESDSLSCHFHNRGRIDCPGCDKTLDTGEAAAYFLRGFPR
jgi:hypothetical protein